MAVLIPAMLVGCVALPQNRVLISSHKASAADIYSLSYPATLRAATIQFSVDPDMPESGIEQLILLRQQLTEKQQALNNLPPDEQQIRDELTTEIQSVRERITVLVRGWVRTRILAEPPPDVAGTLKVTLKTDGKSGELDAGSAVEQLTLATESDVKRHLAYRLNEAFFNEPGIIGPVYKEIMLSIIMLHPATVAEVGVAAEE